MIQAQIERLWRRVQLIIGHGRIRVSDDTGIVQAHQIEMCGGTLRDDTPRIAEYGFTSMPLPNCQALVVFVAGDRSNAAILGTNDDTHRLKNLQPGEVAIYDDQGQSVWIKRGGIEINCAGKPLSILNASIVTHDGVNIGKTHTHGGVTTGAGNTGVPN